MKSNAKEEYLNGDAINLQELALEKAIKRQKAVLTLFCHKCKSTKEFTTTQGLIGFMKGQYKFIGFHSTCTTCGAKIGVTISW